ncbi:ash family protein [Erwiniaceae bacterium L1_54_6]|nr:ash family protein [Erwiniaceae bacterium L1_54_6]
MMLNSSFSLAGAFQYNQRAAAKPVAGISVLRIFLVPEYSGNACAYHSLVAQAGASQKAPDSVMTSFVNSDASRDSFSSLTTEAAKWLLFFLICTRSASARIRGCNMYDPTPLSAEEVLDHCRALAFAIVELDQSLVKELLMYVLQERLDLLNETLQAEASHE